MGEFPCVSTFSLCKRDLLLSLRETARFLVKYALNGASFVVVLDLHLGCTRVRTRNHPRACARALRWTDTGWKMMSRVKLLSWRSCNVPEKAEGPVEQGCKIIGLNLLFSTSLFRSITSRAGSTAASCTRPRRPGWTRCGPSPTAPSRWPPAPTPIGECRSGTWTGSRSTTTRRRTCCGCCPRRGCSVSPTIAIAVQTIIARSKKHFGLTQIGGGKLSSWVLYGYIYGPYSSSSCPAPCKSWQSGRKKGQPRGTKARPNLDLAGVARKKSVRPRMTFHSRLEVFDRAWLSMSFFIWKSPRPDWPSQGCYFIALELCWANSCQHLGFMNVKLEFRPFFLPPEVL